MKLVLFLTLVLLVSACVQTLPEPDPSESIVNLDSIPYLVDTLLLDNGAYCNIETPLIYKDKLIIMITNVITQEGWINCYDKNSLDLMWTWQEAMDEFGVPARGFTSISHVYDGILAVGQSNLTYGIDIETGSTVWKNRDLTIKGSVFGDRNIISKMSRISSKDHHALVKADISEGKWSVLHELMKDDSLDVGSGTPRPFSWKGSDYITFISAKWSAAPPLEIHWLNLYNLSEDRLEWTSDTIPLYHPLSGTPGRQPRFEDGQILLANDAIYSYNVEDGSLEWWTWYGNSFVLSSQLTTANNTVYANNADQYMLALDVHTGGQKFKTTTGGSSSNIAYHDNKCYLASATVGGTNRMMILDSENGTITRNVRAPFRDDDSQWIFDKVVSVDPETELVYTGDHRYLLVYDFGF